MSGYFDHIDPIKFEGAESDNPLAFKYYDAKKVVMGKTIEEHLRVSLLLAHFLLGRRRCLWRWTV